MAHVMKMTKAAVGQMAKHFERATNEHGEYVKFSNQSIDPQRTPQNYNLAPHSELQGEFIKKRCSEVKMLKRKDVNVLCSWVVTAPKGLSSDQEQTFFKESYKFLENRYGKENVVSAYVHMDETTPHMHFAFVPVVKDKEGREKLSAKECVNRSDLKSFHGDLSKHMEQVFGRDIGIENNATKEGNIKVPQLKEQMQHNEKLLEENKNLLTHINTMREEIRDLNNHKYCLERENIELSKTNDGLKQEVKEAKEKGEAIINMYRTHLESIGDDFRAEVANLEYNMLKDEVENIENSMSRVSVEDKILHAHKINIKAQERRENAPHFHIKGTSGRFQAFEYNPITKKLGKKIGESYPSKEEVKEMIRAVYGNDSRFIKEKGSDR